MKNSVKALPAIILSDISKQFGAGESQVSALKGVNLRLRKVNLSRSAVLQAAAKVRYSIFSAELINRVPDRLFF